jgi:hypothetical protein
MHANSTPIDGASTTEESGDPPVRDEQPKKQANISDNIAEATEFVCESIHCAGNSRACVGNTFECLGGIASCFGS